MATDTSRTTKEQRDLDAVNLLGPSLEMRKLLDKVAELDARLSKLEEMLNAKP